MAVAHIVDDAPMTRLALAGRRVTLGMVRTAGVADNAIRLHAEIRTVATDARVNGVTGTVAVGIRVRDGRTHGKSLAVHLVVLVGNTAAVTDTACGRRQIGKCDVPHPDRLIDRRSRDICISAADKEQPCASKNSHERNNTSHHESPPVKRIKESQRDTAKSLWD